MDPPEVGPVAEDGERDPVAEGGTRLAGSWVPPLVTRHATPVRGIADRGQLRGELAG